MLWPSNLYLVDLQVITKESKDTRETNPLYGQLMSMHENVSEDLERVEQAFNLGIGHLDFDELSQEQVDSLHEWHESITQAIECIRFPTLEQVEK